MTLPNDPSVFLLAATAVRDPGGVVRPATPLVEVSGRTLVRVLAPQTRFLDPVTVRMSTPNEGAVIRYTLDGRDPSAASAIYRGPFTVDRSTTVKARAFRPGLDDRHVTAVEFTKLEPRPPVTAPGAVPGLVCRYFEGRWSRVPDFGSVDPVRTAVVPSVAIPEFARPEDFALELTGYLQVPADGLYTLHLFSDDGSVLWLGEDRLIDNDGLHGNGEIAVATALRKGFHPIRIGFFQAPGDANLELWIEGSEVGRGPVPATMLFHSRR